jgi:hypothetical protein
MVKKIVVELVAEVLERADRHDPVDRFVILLPARKVHPSAERAVHRAEQLVNGDGLVFAQRQADDVDVVFLHGTLQRGAPAAPDVEQRHARL